MRDGGMARVFAEWGSAGIEALRGRVTVFVIVDVLSFSTAVDIAVSRGASIYPFPDADVAGAKTTAARAGAVLARRRGGPAGTYSLSPASLLNIPSGTRLVLPSPNGSRLSSACGGTPVLAGCLRNAAAVARRACDMAGEGAIGIIQAGEGWPDGGLRPAIEDMLGAGAIIHSAALPCSAEAQVARDAFRAAGKDLPWLIRHSRSGQELIDRGFSDDVELAVACEVSQCVPELDNGAYTNG